MTRSKIVGAAMLAVGALVLCSLPLLAVENSPQAVLSHPVAFGAGRVTVPLAPPPFNLHLAEPVRRIPKPYVAPVVDPVVQHRGAPTTEFNMVYHVLGVGNGFPGYSVPDAPPDTTLAVGDTEVVQWVNVSYADFNKSTGAIIPINGQDSTLGNTIWANLMPGSACANNNDGDIIVKFDRAAHRWIMAQNVFNGPPYYVCVAISQTSTFSTNTWYAYQFPVVNNGFPDYPKWGVWSTGGPSDGYFQAWNNFGPGGSGFVGPVICGYDRAKMLTGDPTAEQICFQLSNTPPNYQDSLLPADRDSPTQPPSTQDEFFVGSWGDIDNSHLSAYSMHIVDWSTGQATMTGNGDTQLIAIAPYTPACNGNYGGDCVPEPGGNFVDSLGDRLMYRFAYWDDTALVSATATPPLPAHVQHWYVSVDVWNTQTAANNVRWMEFTAPMHTVPATALTVFQQGTYGGNPGDSLWRWMGSLTRDNVDDVLLGYSVSSTSVYPSIAVAGRIYTDPLGTLSPEQYSVHGTGSQVDTADRWGDYSTMAIDPTDNCTFFYTTEYYQLTASFDWSTDISSWKFPNCQ
ncbi:MAG TPA: hypothetical protein VKV05_11680 [Terriglobales bacterium]|nr:hypothetical protein [Terriglobales bacterium]